MSDIIVNSKRDDECYTTSNEARKLCDFLFANNLINDKIIWLPFDTDQSNIYRELNKTHHNIILSSLESGKDFYVYEPPAWDLIISNPPFSNRTALFDRLTSFKKPFIVLQPTYFF